MLSQQLEKKRPAVSFVGLLKGCQKCAKLPLSIQMAKEAKNPNAVLRQAKAHPFVAPYAWNAWNLACIKRDFPERFEKVVNDLEEKGESFYRCLLDIKIRPIRHIIYRAIFLRYGGSYYTDSPTQMGQKDFYDFSGPDLAYCHFVKNLLREFLNFTPDQQNFVKAKFSRHEGDLYLDKAEQFAHGGKISSYTLEKIDKFLVPMAELYLSLYCREDKYWL
jgi:hypothetical protein